MLRSDVRLGAVAGVSSAEMAALGMASLEIRRHMARQGATSDGAYAR